MSKNLWIQKEPLNKFSEAVRTLRESLFAHFLDIDNPVIVLSAPHRGDGCTTLAANLAISIAHSGKKTLLIDGDIAQKGLNEYFPAKTERGFLDFLQGKGGDIPDTGIENLYFLPVGISNNNRHPFDSPKLKEVIEKFRNDFDVVLIDTAPVMESSDSVVLGQKTNGVVLVFQAGNFTREDEIISREILERSGVKIIGAVVNRIREEDIDPYFTYQRFLEMKEK